MRILLPLGAAILAAGLLACPPASRADSYGTSGTYQYKYQYDDKVVVIAIPVAPDYYYSVGDGLTPEEREERIAAAVIRKFGEKFSIDKEKATRKSTTPTRPVELTREDFRLLPEQNAESARIESSARDIFNTNCVRCHKPGASKPGNVRLLTPERKLFADADAKRELRRRERVYESVESGEMPKNGPVLSADQKEALKEWVQLARK